MPQPSLNPSPSCIIRAKLHGVALQDAQLQGASLNGAELHGALLNNAKLQGASLVDAELQGADLSNSAMTYAILSGVYVWRTRTATCRGAHIDHYTFDPIFRSRTIDSAGYVFFRPDKVDPIFSPPDVQEETSDNNVSVPATPDVIKRFIEFSVAGIPNEKQQYEAEKRVRAALIVDPKKEDTAAIGEVWRKCEEASAKVPQAEFDKAHAAYLRNLVCNAEDSRDAIAKGVIRNWISNLEERRDFSTQLARGLLGEDGMPCAATKDLNEADIEKLREAIAAPEAAPKAEPEPSPATAPSLPVAVPQSVTAPALPSNAAPAAAAAPSPAPASSPSPN